MIRSFRPGRMVSYQEIFGTIESLKLSVGENEFFIDDAYCVMPDCTCTESGLYFFKHEGAPIFDFSFPDFSVMYNYATGACLRPREIEYPEMKAVIAAFTNDLNKALEQRHQKLKDRTKQYILAKLERVRIKESLKNLHSPKIGRNAQCPCGSGKKYKMCCLDKER